MTTILNPPERPDDVPWNIDLEEIARLSRTYPKLGQNTPEHLAVLVPLHTVARVANWAQGRERGAPGTYHQLPAPDDLYLFALVDYALNRFFVDQMVEARKSGLELEEHIGEESAARFALARAPGDLELSNDEARLIEELRSSGLSVNSLVYAIGPLGAALEWLGQLNRDALEGEKESMAAEHRRDDSDLVRESQDEAREARVERDLTAGDIAREMVDQGLVDLKEE